MQAVDHNKVYRKWRFKTQKSKSYLKHKQLNSQSMLHGHGHGRKDTAIFEK